jgi:excisionase family DNA binding protein
MIHDMSNDQAVNVKEAAEILGMNPAYVRELIRTNELFATRAGSGARAAYLIAREDLDDYIRYRERRREWTNRPGVLVSDEGVIIGREPEKVAAEIERRHGKDAADWYRERSRRQDLIDQVMAEVDRAGAALEGDFKQADEDAFIEERAQKLAAEVRRRERIARRTQEILEEDDG